MSHFSKKLGNNTPPQLSITDKKFGTVPHFYVAFIFLILLVILLSLFFTPIESKAATEIPWSFYDDGRLVINDISSIYGEPSVSGTIDIDKYYSRNDVPWYPYHDNIISVEFASKTSPKNMANWFYDSNIKSFNSDNLDVSNVTSFAYTFYCCSSLKILRLDSWSPTSSSLNLYYTFAFCSNLETIVCPSIWTAGTSNSYRNNTFYYCFKLLSLSSGKKYNRNSTTASMCNPSNGYFTAPIDACVMGIPSSINLNVDHNRSTPIELRNANFTSYSCKPDGLCVVSCDGNQLTFTGGILPQSGEVTLKFHIDDQELSQKDVERKVTVQVNDSSAVGGNVFWSLHSDGTLVINCADLPDGHDVEYGETIACGDVDTSKEYDRWDSSRTIPWDEYSKSIDTVIFDTQTSPTNMSYWFYNCQNLSSLNFEKLDVSNVSSIKDIFSYCKSLSNLSALSDWDVSSISDLSYMFQCCTSLSDLDPLSKWQFGTNVNLSCMFFECDSLTNLEPLSGWQFKTDTNLSSIFSHCKYLKDLTPLSEWDVSSVSDLSYMFYGCSALTNLEPLSSPDWHFDSAKSLSGMFADCTSLSDLNPISKWSVGHIESFRSIFSGCTSLSDTTPISSWDVSAATDFSSMFYGCTSLEVVRIDSWAPITSTVSVTSIFSECTNLEYVICNSTWTVNSSYGPFNGCTKIKSASSGKEYYDYDSIPYAEQFSPVTGYFTTSVDFCVLGVPNQVSLQINKEKTYNLTLSNATYTDYSCDLQGLCDVSFSNNELTFKASNEAKECTVTVRFQVDDPELGQHTVERKVNIVISDPMGVGALVNWALHTDGTLVINCDDLPDGYKTEYGEVTASGDLDTSHEYNDYSSIIPWNEYKTSIKTVIFDKSTKPTNMAVWFLGCWNLESVDSTHLETSNVTSMYYTFAECCELNEIKGIETWDTSKVLNTQNMFYGCHALRFLRLDSWMLSFGAYGGGYSSWEMFEDCSNLEAIVCENKWDIAAYYDYDIFAGCNNLRSYSSGKVYSNVGNVVSMCNPTTGYFTDPATVTILGVPSTTKVRKGFATRFPLDVAGEASITGYSCEPDGTCTARLDGSALVIEANSEAEDCELSLTFKVGDISDIQKTVSITISDAPTYTPTVRKEVEMDEGDLFDYASNHFKFTLSSASGDDPLPTSESVETDDEGVATWETLTFNHAGTFEYTVLEDKGEPKGVSNDKTPHNLVIEVDEEGNLEASWDDTVLKTYGEINSSDSGWVPRSTYYLDIRGDEVRITNSEYRNYEVRTYGIFTPSQQRCLIGTWHSISQFDISRMPDDWYITAAYGGRYSVADWKAENPGERFGFVTSISAEDSDSFNGYSFMIFDDIPTVYGSISNTSIFIPKVQKQVTDTEGSAIRDWDFVSLPFTFTITGVNGSPEPTKKTVKTDSNGIVQWEELELEREKTYEWIITEQTGEYDNIEYDETEHHLTVTVDNTGDITQKWDGENIESNTNGYPVIQNHYHSPVALPNAGLENNMMPLLILFAIIGLTILIVYNCSNKYIRM